MAMGWLKWQCETCRRRKTDMHDQPSEDTGKSAPGWRSLKLLGYGDAPSVGHRGRSMHESFAATTSRYDLCAAVVCLESARSCASPSKPWQQFPPPVACSSTDPENFLGVLFGQRPESRVSIATCGERQSRR